MEKIILKLGDSVRLYNGTFGIISGIEYGSYRIEISDKHKKLDLVHILNVRYVNSIDCEKNNIEICLR